MRNADKRGSDRNAAEFKMSSLTLGSLLHLTSASTVDKSSYQYQNYQSIINGISKYNTDMQTVKRLLNKRIRNYVEREPEVLLPKSVKNLITFLLTDDDEFYYTKTFREQICKSLIGNFKAMKHTRCFS